MSPVRVKGSLLMTRPPEVFAGAYRDAKVEGYAEVGRFWHAKYLPGHFTAAGGRIYGYQLRSGQNEPRLIQRGNRLVNNRKYFWVKRRIKHHERPLVWSGALMRSSLASYRLKATAKGVEVRFGSGARALNFSRHRRLGARDYPDMRTELTTVLPGELEEMRGRAVRRIARELNSRKGSFKKVSR